MKYSQVFLQTFIALLFCCAIQVNAQVDASNSPITPSDNDDGRSLSVKDMLSKQRMERDKKDYALLLERGEMVLKLSAEIETSFEKNNQLTLDLKKKLQTLEKLVIKIRNELGGDEDNGENTDEIDKSDLKKTIDYLQKTSKTLVGELKNSTRFTISTIAIESSNAIIRAAKFLRLSK